MTIGLKLVPVFHAQWFGIQRNHQIISSPVILTSIPSCVFQICLSPSYRCSSWTFSSWLGSSLDNASQGNEPACPFKVQRIMKLKSKNCWPLLILYCPQASIIPFKMLWSESLIKLLRAEIMEQPHKIFRV